MGRNAGQLQSLDRRMEKRTVWTLEFENNRDLHYFAMFTLSEEERTGRSEIFESISRALVVTVPGIYLYCAEEESQDT